MSLGVCKLEDVPPGARILHKDEVIEYYWKVISQHKNPNLTAPFLYGIPALGCLTLITNVSLLSSYRRQLKIFRKGFFIMSGVCGFLPAVMNAICHYQYVSSNIFIENCVTCAHTRSMLFTLGFSFGYALTMTPLYTILVAERMFSTDIPGLMTSDRRQKTFSLFKKLIRRASTRLYILFVINTCASTLITGLEQDAYFKINEDLEKNHLLQIDE